MKNSDAENLESGSPRLSAHEMAALMLLGHAPVKVDVEVEDLDMTALHDAGLAQRIEREPGWQEYSITSEGRDVLRVLGALTAPEDVSEWLAASGTL
ncbi:hypothetical protein QF001_007190 [Paraburkholderia youngii]|uniref:Uncharacterized protein n=1 Tax=Paraburkholderia youngii TaxID=2782701 RepID=A0A7Y6K1I1_9BURK|nr:hypothetical protein [Paraburkholderia youngii]NUY02710.1 hypothetical protein [Paraburkholderia youngii]